MINLSSINQYARQVLKIKLIMFTVITCEGKVNLLNTRAPVVHIILYNRSS